MIFCARATRGLGRPSPGQLARLGVPVGGRVRKTRAVEDQSALISQEIASELGRGHVANRGIAVFALCNTCEFASENAYLLLTVPHCISRRESTF